MDRKDFLKKCAALTAGVACLDLLLPGCASLPYADFVMDDAQAVVKKSHLAGRGFVLLKVETLPAPVYLGQGADGTYAALLLRCTHRGCTVRPAGPILQCPCHGSQYSTEGEVLEGPAPQNLHRFPVTTDAEYVRVQVNGA